MTTPLAHGLRYSPGDGRTVESGPKTGLPAGVVPVNSVLLLPTRIKGRFKARALRWKALGRQHLAPLTKSLTKSLTSKAAALHGSVTALWLSGL